MKYYLIGRCKNYERNERLFKLIKSTLQKAKFQTASGRLNKKVTCFKITNFTTVIAMYAIKKISKTDATCKNNTKTTNFEVTIV